MNNGVDRLTALNIFRQIAELGSFAEAGRQLGLSPSAVSKNIGELEARLGARLINRTTRRLHLTEAGRVYLFHIVRVLDDLEDADRALGPLQQMPSGTLRISAPMSLTLTCLSTELAGFLARYPELALEVDLDDRQVDVVREGYDLAIRGVDTLGDSSLIARKLTTMSHVVCAAPSYLAAHGVPREPNDLVKHNCIRYTLSGHADLWGFRKGGQTERVPITGRYKVSSSLAIRDALIAGFGISLVPHSYVRDDLTQGRLQAVLADWAPVESTIYAVYPSRQYVTPKLRVFLDFLVERFGRS